MSKRNLIIGIVILVALVGGAFLYTTLQLQKNTEMKRNNAEKTQGNVKEVKKQTQEQKTTEKQETTKEQTNNQNQTINGELKPEEKIDTSDWKTYRNEKFGFEFRYPRSWGDIIVWKQKCFDGYKNDAKVKHGNKEPCLQIALRATNMKGLFLATETPNIIGRRVPRCGFWGDGSSLIKNEDYIRNFCMKNSDNKSCNTYVTHNNLVVAKNYESMPLSEDASYVYYISFNHPPFRGIKMSSAELPYTKEKNTTIIENIINSLKFLQ